MYAVRHDAFHSSNGISAFVGLLLISLLITPQCEAVLIRLELLNRALITSKLRHDAKLCWDFKRPGRIHLYWEDFKRSYADQTWSAEPGRICQYWSELKWSYADQTKWSYADHTWSAGPGRQYWSHLKRSYADQTWSTGPYLALFYPGRALLFLAGPGFTY